jgi:RNA methyltransferase, TrmH family
MSSRTIDKRANPTVKHLRDARDGNVPYALFCEGHKVVEELLESDLPIKNVFTTKDSESLVITMLQEAGKPQVPITVLSNDVMDYVSDVESPPGVIALSERPRPFKLDAMDMRTPPLCLILHRLQLPQNVGGMLRTAEAAGVRYVFVTKGTADPFSPKAVRGASGSAFRVNIRTGDELETVVDHLKKLKIKTVAATPYARVTYDEHDWRQPSALAVGSEGSGFSANELKLFPDQIKIPMVGRVESLNAGTAAAICLFEASKQRRS